MDLPLLSLAGKEQGVGASRPVSIVDAGIRKAFDLRVEVPVEDMSRLGEAMQPDQGEIPEGATSLLRRNSIWPAIYPRLLALVREHRSTIIFVNSRRLAERSRDCRRTSQGKPTSAERTSSAAICRRAHR